MTNPVIDLRSDLLQNPPTRRDIAVLEAWMLWPDDQRLRDAAIETSSVQFEIDIASSLSNEPLVPVAAVRRAAAAVPLATVRADARPRFADGIRAGLYLREALVKLDTDPTNAFMKSGADKIARQPLFGSMRERRTFENNVWPRFRPVSHLWAAALDGAFEVSRSASPGQVSAAWPCRPEGLLDFLSAAEGYRVRGETERTRQSPHNILPADQMLRLPADLTIEPAALHYVLKGETTPDAM
jgi:hypothetical protein